MAALPVEPWSPSLELFDEVALYVRQHAGVYLELLDGVVTAKGVPTPEHVASMEFLNRLFVESTDASTRVRVEAPLPLAEGWVPRPDIALVLPGTRHLIRHPASAALACEIAVSSKAADRNVKRPAYARAGVAEYWIVIPKEQRLEVFREPAGDDFRQHFAATGGVVESVGVPSIRLDLDALWRYVAELTGT